MKRIAFLLLIGLITGSGTLADQPLETSETQQLIERLCRRSTTGWIQQGRIEAIHRASDTLSGEVTETHETVITDGNRFTWQIRIDSHSDSAQSKGQGGSDFMEWNQERMFVWDGESYTLYFRPGNHAIVHENPSIPVNVNGPLTAGYIPWGQGAFSLESLSAAQSSATRVQTEDGSRIQLLVQPADRPLMQFVLDPARDNVVLSYTLLRPDSKVVQTYGNFTEHQGQWTPMNILIDRYDNDQLQTSDTWEIISLQDSLPLQNLFAVSLQDKALVEHHSPLLAKPVFYRHSSGLDIQPLLEKRFMSALKKNLRKQNCGTVAAEKVLSELGVSVTDPELESLVDDLSGDTSLYQVQQLAQQKGLFCLPVKTSVSGLGRFKDAQVLLHFPKKKHFVVLDRIDQDNVWLIDLDRQTFYHPMDLPRFEQEWVGIALVVSDQPLFLEKNDKPVPDPVLKKIKGSADYSCSDLIQEYDVNLCPEMTQGTCGARYEMWYDRYGCELDTSGGYCDGTGVVGSVYASCIEDPSDPGQCTTTGNYISRNMRACQP